MANENNNRISATLTQQDIDDIKHHVQQIESKLPFLVGLTTAERQRLPKIHRSNKIFVDDALRTAEENQSVIPDYVDIAELRKDLELYESLSKVLLPIQQLTEKLRDTQILAGSESYTSALVIYNMFQMAAKMGLPGMDTVVAQLAERFQMTASSSTKEEENTADE